MGIGNFRHSSSISEAEEQLDVCNDSSQSCDLKLSIAWVGDTSDDEAEDETNDEAEDEADDEVEDEADSVELQLPRIDGRNTDIMRPGLTREQIVVKVLNMIRRREIYEFNHKLHITVPARFCHFNIALFDLDKEREFLCSLYIA